MYLTYNEAKSVVAERFIRTLKNRIFNHMTAISKNVHFDLLDDIVNKYNNTVHRIINMDDYYAEYNGIAFNEDPSMELHSNKKNPEFKVGDKVRISKYENIFAKDYTPNWPEEVLLLIKLKIQFLGLMLIVIWIVKKLLKVFMKKHCKKQIKKNLE